MTEETEVAPDTGRPRRKRGGIPWSRGGMFAYAARQEPLPDEEIMRRYPRYMQVSEAAKALSVSYHSVYIAWREWLRLPFYTLTKQTNKGNRFIQAVDIWMLLEFRKYGRLLPPGRRVHRGRGHPFEPTPHEIGRKIVEEWAAKAAARAASAEEKKP
jgi:hypothetical protein